MKQQLSQIVFRHAVEGMLCAAEHALAELLGCGAKSVYSAERERLAQLIGEVRKDLRSFRLSLTEDN